MKKPEQINNRSKLGLLLATTLPLGLVGCGGGGSSSVKTAAASQSVDADDVLGGVNGSDSASSSSDTSDLGADALLAEAREVTGSALVGPLQYASVFLDTNRNGVRDGNEQQVYTNADGEFSFETRVASPQFVVSTLPVTMNKASGVVAGEMTLVSVAGSDIASPITTLIVDSGLTSSAVATQLSLSINDLGNFDPYDNSTASTDAVAYLQRSHQIATIHDALYAAVSGSGASTDGLSDDIMGAISTTLQTTEFDSSSPRAFIEAVVNNTLAPQFKSALQASPDLKAVLIDATKNQVIDINALDAVVDFSPQSSDGKGVLSNSQVVAKEIYDAFQADDSDLVTLDDGTLLDDLALLAPATDLGFLDGVTLSDRATVDENSAGADLEFQLYANEGGIADDGFIWSLLEIDGTDYSQFDLVVTENGPGEADDTYKLVLKNSPDYEDATNPDHIYQVALGATSVESGKTVAELLVVEINNVVEIV